MTEIPARLTAACAEVAERSAWLRQLPDVIAGLTRAWALTLDAPFDHDDASCAWVAPATTPAGDDAVLKIGMPHMEAEQEIDGLAHWAGDPTVRLLRADRAHNAMLLERCRPGSSLRALPEGEQDRIIAQLLRRAWRAGTPRGFRHLSVMTGFWCAATRADSAKWPDADMVRRGLSLLEELSAPSGDDVLLLTDLHAGNVLRAQREAWLVIDPKPFVGDAAYDATQHLFNCRTRLLSDPDGTIGRFAELAGVDHERVRQWLFARAAAEPRESWDDDLWLVARGL